MFEVLIYGLLKGGREIVKKKSMKKSSIIEVLFFYTLFAFLFVCLDAKNAMGIDMKYMGLIIFKAFVIFLAWMLSFRAIKKMPISLYGVLDLSRVLFATFLALVVLHETLGLYQMIGLVLVSTGLLMLKGNPFKKKKVEVKNDNQNDSQDDNQNNRQADDIKQQEPVSTGLVIIALTSCMLNALSGLLDKILMKDVTSAQLQFWYMLFLVGFYLVYIIATRQKIDVKNSLKNGWIWLLAFLFVIADRSLFLANANPNSRITVMTLIKQSGCIVTILAGKFIFHEKNIAYKLLCAVVVIAGIVVAVL